MFQRSCEKLNEIRNMEHFLEHSKNQRRYHNTQKHTLVEFKFIARQNSTHLLVGYSSHFLIHIKYRCIRYILIHYQNIIYVLVEYFQGGFEQIGVVGKMKVIAIGVV